MKFHSVVQLDGKTATGIRVPDEVVEGLGQGKRVKVVVKIGGYSYRSSIASMGGVYMLPISAEHRKGAGVNAGDEVDVEVEVDSAPREVVVPEDFAAALDQHEAARKAFEVMSYSHKQQHVLAIEGAKTAETRQRRIEKAIAALGESKG